MHVTAKREENMQLHNTEETNGRTDGYPAEPGLESAFYINKDRGGGNHNLFFPWYLCGKKGDPCRTTGKGSGRRNTDTAHGTAADGRRIFSASFIQPPTTGGHSVV